MQNELCCLCFSDDRELREAPCQERPELVDGNAGMYHCPDCGTMLLAGIGHFRVCELCFRSLSELPDVCMAVKQS